MSASRGMMSCILEAKDLIIELGGAAQRKSPLWKARQQCDWVGFQGVR